MLSGKQREIQAREELFVDVARTLLLDDGYQAVSISRVADITQFSKGTVYQVFRTKEELVAALGIQCRTKLHAAMQLARRFQGRPRERLVAIGEAIGHYIRRYPHDQRILKIIDSETILQKVGEEQQLRMAEYDVRIYQILLDIVDDAIAQGDLVLPDKATPQGLCFAFWAMIDGAFASMMGGAPLEAVGITDPVAVAVRNGHYLADGYGWRPLSTEWDYEETSRRIRSTILREERDFAEMENLVSSTSR